MFEDDDRCGFPGCTNSLDDGEGYDGYCGEHADQREEEDIMTEDNAWPEGHFTSVGIPVKEGYFLTRCKCGAERLTTTIDGGWAWSTNHREDVSAH
jgi:hypothetical protein